MGIANLNKFLKNNCPEVYNEVHLSHYAFKKLAIDISLYLFKYKTIYGNKWVSAFINLVSCLRKNNIHCTFIYDTGAVPEKIEERKKRASSKEKMKQKLYNLEEALDIYCKTNEVTPFLKEYISNKKNKRILLRRKNNDKLYVNVSEIEDDILRFKNQTVSITSKDFDFTKKLFDILNIPYFQAPLEAETCCSDLCKRGIIDAVVSEDTDVLAYGAPYFLTKLNTRTETCVEIKYEQILESLEITENQFLDLCIMCGTDYNKNIFRIGPEKSYKLIKKHGSIEGIQEHTNLDISILNHIRSRELFKNYEILDTKISYCGTPNFIKLEEFLFTHNIRSDLSFLKNSCKPPTVIFKDNSDSENDL